MRNFGKTLLAAALAVCFGASSASAAFIVLNPVDQPAPGPATFEIILDGLNGALIQDTTVEPHFAATGDVDLANTSAGAPSAGDFSPRRMHAVAAVMNSFWGGAGVSTGSRARAQPHQS